MYRNRRLETLHKTADALHHVGALDTAMMRDIAAFCRTEVEALRGEVMARRCETNITRIGGPK